MRFVSCFVSGFGKLCNQSFDLSKDVVEIKAKNGGGKTTLAVFLESMLFGLENSPMPIPCNIIAITTR